MEPWSSKSYKMSLRLNKTDQSCSGETGGQLIVYFSGELKEPQMNNR